MPAPFYIVGPPAFNRRVAPSDSVVTRHRSLPTAFGPLPVHHRFDQEHCSAATQAVQSRRLIVIQHRNTHRRIAADEMTMNCG
jgi:hypothetical protein